MVQIDAHGDMRFEYEGSHHNHACVMRRVLEINGFTDLTSGNSGYLSRRSRINR
ncbi:hypothetical protein MICAG_360034 [Microcystis aeruginosa PCC 9808]|uniref:Agmatinase n=1 Tax=Microcystis aeruginosa PCC 9808 TaxID=1160284 RepID=I4I041_MICAE|nr:hypothetical protein MICAG_360034 [Microcystis aeruginosa PCC 9808]